MTSVALLCSGGLDSTTLAYWLLREGRSVLPVFLDYGQHCAAKERTTLSDVLPDALRDHVHELNLRSVFAGSTSRLISEADPWREEVVPDDLYVPYRALLFFAAAAAFAQTHNITEVYSAFINSARAKELDCTSTFLNGLDAFAANVGAVRFLTPFRAMTKREVVRLAESLNVPIGRTFSCQMFSDVPCGACPNCVERLDALVPQGDRE